MVEYQVINIEKATRNFPKRIQVVATFPTKAAAEEWKNREDPHGQISSGIREKPAVAAPTRMGYEEIGEPTGQTLTGGQRAERKRLAKQALEKGFAGEQISKAERDALIRTKKVSYGDVTGTGKSALARIEMQQEALKEQTAAQEKAREELSKERQAQVFEKQERAKKKTFAPEDQALKSVLELEIAKQAGGSEKFIKKIEQEQQAQLELIGDVKGSKVIEAGGKEFEISFDIKKEAIPKLPSSQPSKSTFQERVEGLEAWEQAAGARAKQAREDLGLGFLNIKGDEGFITQVGKGLGNAVYYLSGLGAAEFGEQVVIAGAKMGAIGEGLIKAPKNTLKELGVTGKEVLTTTLNPTTPEGVVTYSLALTPAAVGGARAGATTLKAKALSAEFKGKSAAEFKHSLDPKETKALVKSKEISTDVIDTSLSTFVKKANIKTKALVKSGELMPEIKVKPLKKGVAWEEVSIEGGKEKSISYYEPKFEPSILIRPEDIPKHDIVRLSYQTDKQTKAKRPAPKDPTTLPDIKIEDLKTTKEGKLFLSLDQAKNLAKPYKQVSEFETSIKPTIRSYATTDILIEPMDLARSRDIMRTGRPAKKGKPSREEIGFEPKIEYTYKLPSGAKMVEFIRDDIHTTIYRDFLTGKISKRDIKLPTKKRYATIEIIEKATGKGIKKQFDFITGGTKETLISKKRGSKKGATSTIEVGSGNQILLQKTKPFEKADLSFSKLKEEFRSARKQKTKQKAKIKQKQREGLLIIEDIFLKPKTKTKSKIKVRSLADTHLFSGLMKAQKFKTDINSRFKPLMDVDLAISSFSKSAAKVKSKVRSKVKSALDIKSISDMASISEMGILSKSAADIKSDLRVDQKLDLMLETRSIVDIDTRIDKKERKKRRKGFRFSLFDLEDKTIDPDQAFNVFVKEKNKFIKVNDKPLLRNQAKNLGSDAVDNTAAASFVLRKTKQKAEALFDDFMFIKQNKFRSPKSRSKLPPKTFIEKDTFRIDTRGEVKGISVKGWLANKRKAAKNNMFNLDLGGWL